MFKRLKFEGFYIYKPNVYKDRRGNFRRHYCKREFAKIGLKESIAQGNVSESLKKGTLRGFHYKSG